MRTMQLFRYLEVRVFYERFVDCTNTATTSQRHGTKWQGSEDTVLTQPEKGKLSATDSTRVSTSWVVMGGGCPAAGTSHRLLLTSACPCQPLSSEQAPGATNHCDNSHIGNSQCLSLAWSLLGSFLSVCLCLVPSCLGKLVCWTEPATQLEIWQPPPSRTSTEILSFSLQLVITHPAPHHTSLLMSSLSAAFHCI